MLNNTRVRRNFYTLALLASVAFVFRKLERNDGAGKNRSRILDALRQYTLPALQRNDQASTDVEQTTFTGAVSADECDSIKSQRRKQLVEDFEQVEARWKGKTLTAKQIAERYGISLTPNPICKGGSRVGWIPCTECSNLDGDYGVIPRLIFQTWKEERLPESICKAALTWTQVNPEYDYLFFDDMAARRMIKMEFGKNISDNFDLLKVGAAKSDVWRLMVVYLFGGIYFDIDICPRPEHPFKTWGFGENTVVTGNGVEGPAQWGLIYTPQHPIIRDALLHTLENLADRVPGYAKDLSFFQLGKAFESHGEFDFMPGWGENMGGRVDTGYLENPSVTTFDGKMEMMKYEGHWTTKPLEWPSDC